MNWSYLLDYHSRCGQQIRAPANHRWSRDCLSICQTVIQASTYIMWHYWAQAVITSIESTFILWALVSSGVHLTVEQKVPPASRLFLWRSSPPLINPLRPFVGRPTGQPSRQAKSDMLFAYFRLPLSWPEGMLSSWTKFASLLFISAVADCNRYGWHTTGLSSPCGCEHGCVREEKHQGVQYIVTSEECIMSLCRIRLCVRVSIVSFSEQCSQCEPAL